ncbi:MAG: VOC family protein [Motilibacteraceae bacterium]
MLEALEVTVSKIVHFELPVDDPERASAFYGAVLGWQVDQYEGQPYWLVRGGPEDERGADGALVKRGELHRAPVLIAGVADVDAVLDAVVQHGGSVVHGKEPVVGMGWSAYLEDPEGNVLGVFQPDMGAR